jgi:hypothetical protein
MGAKVKRDMADYRTQKIECQGAISSSAWPMNEGYNSHCLKAQQFLSPSQITLLGMFIGTPDVG